MSVTILVLKLLTRSLSPVPCTFTKSIQSATKVTSMQGATAGRDQQFPLQTVSEYRGLKRPELEAIIRSCLEPGLRYFHSPIPLRYRLLSMD